MAATYVSDSSARASAASPRAMPSWGAYAISVVLVAVATVMAMAVREAVGASNLSLIFVLPVLAAAMSFGFGPAVAAALIGALAFNFFLLPPLYTFRVADPANAWAVILLLITAAVVSAMAAEARRRTVEAKASADQARALQTLAHDLVGAQNRQAVVIAGAQALARIFQAPAVVLEPGPDDMETVAHAGGAALTPADRDAARWAMGSGLPVKGGLYPAEAAAYDFWPVQTPHRIAFVVGLAVAARENGRPERPDRVVDAVANHLSVALDREASARQLLQSRLAKASEQLKSDLLAAVSHDLKTPLSTMLVALQTLRRFPGGREAERDELLGLAEAETGRLAQMVANLLDMSRLDARAGEVQTQSVDAAELTASALARLATALAGREVIDQVQPGARLKVDPPLFETALANVVENAAKYAPEGPISLRSGADGDEGWIEVVDAGPGFPGPVEVMLQKFTRGVSGDGRPPGLGLGLAIARGFLEAQGGRIEAGDRSDGPGAWVRLIAPLA